MPRAYVRRNLATYFASTAMLFTSRRKFIRHRNLPTSKDGAVHLHIGANPVWMAFTPLLPGPGRELPLNLSAWSRELGANLIASRARCAAAGLSNHSTVLRQRR